MNCSSPGSSVHRIFQSRMLERVAISLSRGSSRPGDRTWVSCTAGRFFTDWATREAPGCWVSSLWVLNCRQNMLCEHRNIEPKSTGTEFYKCPKMVADGPRVLSPSPTWEARWPVKVLGIVSLPVAPNPLLPPHGAACPWLWVSSEQNSAIKEALPLHRTQLPDPRYSPRLLPAFFPWVTPQDSQELQLNEL